LFAIGAIDEVQYYDRRWKFLKNVNRVERRIEGFWKLGPRFYFRPKWGETLWLSRLPEPVLKPAAEKYGAGLFANLYDLKRGEYTIFEDLSKLYKEATKSAKPSELLDDTTNSVKNTVKTKWVSEGKVFESITSARRHKMWSLVWTFMLLTALGAGLGVMSLYFAPSWELRAEMFPSYFKVPGLALMNILPIVMFAYFLYYLTNRLWVTSLISGFVTFALTLGNHYKLQLRNDPFYAVDVLLLREIHSIVTDYNLQISSGVLIYAGVCIVATAVLAFTRRRIKHGLSRVGGLAVLICVTTLISRWFVSETVYNRLENEGFGSAWNPAVQYMQRGFVYPFLYSLKDIQAVTPEDYDEEAAKALLDSYAFSDMPEEKKVNIIAVMCEAFADFSDVESLRFTYDVYRPWHDIQDKSMSGQLITNVFAGGTIDTERAFLTGFPGADRDFRTDVNSYVRYLVSQGYYAENSHPGYEWFYNRGNVSNYLGFDRFFFYETDETYRRHGGNKWFLEDDEYFEEIRNTYEAHIARTNLPYFSFNVTYQNHGPYDSEMLLDGREYVAQGDLSDES
jgi:phosphoglycerol transferase MdoB-like AlkP superfamily enzyme